jgi:hypothetical protein
LRYTIFTIVTVSRNAQVAAFAYDLSLFSGKPLSYLSPVFSYSYIQAAQFHNTSGVGENLGFADVRLGNSAYWLPLFIAFMTLMAAR